MPPGPRHSIDAGLDSRLRSFSTRSWNAYEAVFSLQQLTSLAPIFTAELQAMYGRSGLGDARRMWGTIADLCSAITGMPATMATLLELGFEQAADVGHVIDLTGDFKLSEHPILKPLDFRPANLGDLEPVLIHAVAHDRVAKPLLELMRDEMHAYDYEAMSSRSDDTENKSITFSDLLHRLPDAPDSFPWWDGRPMFLDEQQAFMEFLARHIGAEIVAENLVDESLGMFILYMSGHINRSDVTGNVVLNHEHLPHRLLGRPVGVLCHQVGNAILDALKSTRATDDVFSRLYVVERAVLSEFDIDISKGLASTRNIATDRAVREFTGQDVDIDLTQRVSKVWTSGTAVPYEFPKLESD